MEKFRQTMDFSVKSCYNVVNSTEIPAAIRSASAGEKLPGKAVRQFALAAASALRNASNEPFPESISLIHTALAVSPQPVGLTTSFRGGR